MNTSEAMEMKVKVANLYYRDNLSQQEIANQFNTSRASISRLLKSCVEEGIVTIHILNTSIHQYGLENQLMRKFGLQYVSVVGSGTDTSDVFQKLGTVMNEHLRGLISKNVRIGLSAGATVTGLIYQLSPIDNFQIDVYQMCGDASHHLSNCTSFMTIEMAKVIGGTPHAIHVPLLSHTKVLRDLLMEEPINKAHFAALSDLDIAVVGLGRIDSILPTTSDTWYNYSTEIDDLRKKNAVGDICGNFIDADGNYIDSDIQERTIAIDIRRLHEIPHTIAVAVGRDKKRIATAAIRGGYINSLIIDEDLAHALLDE